MMMNRRLRLFAVMAFSVAVSALAAGTPRVAVWDPVHSLEGGRYPVNAPYLSDVAKWLSDANVQVERLTAEQIADAKTFSAERFDALMLEGNVFPEQNLDAYKRFMNAGGVLIALSAENPFYNKIAFVGGVWHLSPQTPNFAWETRAINEALGIQFKWMMDMAYSGEKHAATLLLESYLPQAKSWTAGKPLLARWYLPTTGKMYPLIRSRQIGGGDYTPQVYLVVNGNSRAIMCASKIFTGNAEPKLWPWGRETVVALANLAHDLRGGKVDLDKQLAVTVPSEVVLPGPLEVRPASAGINPEQASPIFRVGRFDGSRLDLGKTLPAGEHLQLPADAKGGQFPGELQPGASVEVSLPALGAQTTFLRVRGAFAKTGAGLAVKLGGTPIIDERFVYRLSAGTVNINFSYKDAPNEFTRICFIPPSALSSRTLLIGNPGIAPIYFDALQIERRTEPARAMGLGLGNGTTLAYDGVTKLTPEICREWTYFRCCGRPWWVGAPDDPKAWDRFDKHVERYLALSPHVQLQIEGTPEWAAISAERYKSAGKSRPQFTPPDLAKYEQIVRRIVTKYRGRVEGWEIWNEPNIQTFWLGNREEFAAFVNAMAPVIRELDPKAPIILGGLAGTVSGYLDPNAAELVRSGATKKVDLFGFHPYARNGAWDLPYGLIEGHLMNLGSDIEIYSNETGYNMAPDFGGEGGSEVWQANLTNRAVARLLACGAAKVTIFNAGGDGDTYGLLDKSAQPRPAYGVFTDYLNLARDGGRRLDATLCRADGNPVEGIYVAAASHNNGAVTLVVNPADIEIFDTPDELSFDFTKGGTGWTCFTGKAQYAKGRANLTVGDKGYVGFFRKADLDPAASPTIAVNVPECDGKWSLTLKFAGGEDVLLYEGTKPGQYTFNYADKLKDCSKRQCEVSFRFFAAASVESVRFPIAAGATAPRQPIPVRVLLPLNAPGAYTASATQSGNVIPVALKTASTQDAKWAQIELPLGGRTVVKLVPQPPAP